MSQEKKSTKKVEKAKIPHKGMTNAKVFTIHTISRKLFHISRINILHKKSPPKTDLIVFVICLWRGLFYFMFSVNLFFLIFLIRFFGIIIILVIAIL